MNVDLEVNGKHVKELDDAERVKATVTIGPARVTLWVRPVRARGFASDSSSMEATFELGVHLGPRGWRTVTRHQIAIPMMPGPERAEGAGF